MISLIVLNQNIQYHQIHDVKGLGAGPEKLDLDIPTNYKCTTAESCHTTPLRTFSSFNTNAVFNN